MQCVECLASCEREKMLLIENERLRTELRSVKIELICSRSAIEELHSQLLNELSKNS